MLNQWQNISFYHLTLAWGTNATTILTNWFAKSRQTGLTQ